MLASHLADLLGPAAPAVWATLLALAAAVGFLLHLGYAVSMAADGPGSGVASRPITLPFGCLLVAALSMQLLLAVLAGFYVPLALHALLARTGPARAFDAWARQFSSQAESGRPLPALLAIFA